MRKHPAEKNRNIFWSRRTQDEAGISELERRFVFSVERLVHFRLGAWFKPELAAEFGVERDGALELLPVRVGTEETQIPASAFPTT